MSSALTWLKLPECCRIKCYVLILCLAIHGTSIQTPLVLLFSPLQRLFGPFLHSFFLSTGPLAFFFFAAPSNHPIEHTHRSVLLTECQTQHLSFGGELAELQMCWSVWKSRRYLGGLTRPYSHVSHKKSQIQTRTRRGIVFSRYLSPRVEKTDLGTAELTTHNPKPELRHDGHEFTTLYIIKWRIRYLSVTHWQSQLYPRVCLEILNCSMNCLSQIIQCKISVSCL